MPISKIEAFCPDCGKPLNIRIDNVGNNQRLIIDECLFCNQEIDTKDLLFDLLKCKKDDNKEEN